MHNRKLNRRATGEPKMSRRPNIITILVDDMGFSDLGCYGGEIETPNLDALAGNGLRLTQFYNTARCCPARASLLTGLYPHQAGVGMMVYRMNWQTYTRGNCMQDAWARWAADSDVLPYPENRETPRPIPWPPQVGNVSGPMERRRGGIG